MRKSLLVLLLAATIFVSGCTGTEESVEVAEVGDYVLVDYTGELEDGTVFDTSIGRQPLGFTVGAGQMIAGFDNGVVGMAVGESKILTIPPEEAYGTYLEVQTIPIQNLPDPNGTYVEGGQLMTAYGNLTIVNVTESEITVDVQRLNHPLAGETLIFNVTLVSIGEEE
ncbi:FKBP-type peptidyl-prolyl cis-trans isomerase 2 [Methanohalophilus levihalophilus]|uniref:FKBP-type peptidyl-prolyl cis-trans isomerase n=1 Tax=Methanohalophilus levihalophilus TaxID=1431282 RepID=UPI001AE54911|nr:FKBP-type peptidyl-prolyl cis-trans isomerase [Methanohalophilus levihalophilus]MBP2029134.1 FKBP-type peptidyl-prolyl cis-trans isomerase 2 [Methanohalophilus levihalophilus]